MAPEPRLVPAAGVIAVSLLAAGLGAARHSVVLVAAACLGSAASFAALALDHARQSRAAASASRPVTTEFEADVLAGFGRLMALCYVWASATMFGAYGLSGLHWRHDWQYGAVFALVGGALYLLTTDRMRDKLELRRRTAVTLAAAASALHAVAGIVIAVFLLVSGKLMTERIDWAANYVFLGLTVAIAAISILALQTSQQIAKS